jgi:hypothetical protein
MKSANRTSVATKNLEILISKLSENEILTIPAMSCVRGGDEGNGGGDIIIMPPKPGKV